MRALFNYDARTLSANGTWEINDPCNFIFFRLGDSAVEMMIEPGEWMPTFTGLQFKADFGELGKIKFRSTAGGTVQIVYGFGSVAAGLGFGERLTGSGSPEGVVAASAGATYYDTASGGFWVKATGSGLTGWVQLIA